MPPVGVAFFDLDRTILAVSSAPLWVRSELRAGRLRARDAAWALGWIVRYHLGQAALDDAIRAAVATLADEPERALDERTRAFWDRELSHRIRPGARRAVERERARGRALVLLTSSSPYLSRPAVEALGLDDYLCNRFVVGSDGRFTGAAVEPLCFGPGKVVHARRFAEARGVELSECSFYTDSFSDLAALEAVGEPVVINPDLRLKRAAAARGWPVVDWGSP